MSKPEEIATVRRFHRLVTQRAGALEEHLLGRDRPLGQSRVLFEIGRDGASLRDLRARLGLDSGYLTRLVQALAGAGLVRVDPAPSDERVRVARLTEDGLAELAEIDRRSDDAARSILDPLTEGQREGLVAAMSTVHRLLGAASLRISVVAPDVPEARWCLERYYEELEERFDDGFDPGTSSVADPSAFCRPSGAFLVAEIDGRPVGSGALVLVDAHTAYIKRMWVDGSLRGMGLGRRLLEALEEESRSLGAVTVQLETNRALTEAIGLYRSAGYRPVEPFNDEVYAHHWFRKSLD
jgi:DNA-binding MarR family transcriptional regulator/GNAT superfamily N-acetyltransferase